MICIPCRSGGDVSAKIRTGQTPAVLGRTAAEAHHALCKGGTWCDCQHGISRPDPRLSFTTAAGWCRPSPVAV